LNFFCAIGRGKLRSKALLISYNPAIAQYVLADVKKWTSSHIREEK